MQLRHLAALLVVLLTHSSSVYAGVRPRWADVTLRDGVYKNVLVAVGPGVQQDDGLIEHIKTLFRDASRELAAATGGRVRFGHIDILVPTSWNTTTATPATAQRFGNADFIVAPAKLSHGDAPYTQRVGGCGKRGEFVHITPKYVSDPTYASRWGPRGRTMVHEWAHYWWGVFDEYPTRNKPYYTDPNGQLSPVMCPANFPGDWLTPRGDPCQAGARGCRFIPQDPPETGPSFMAFYHLPNVTQFCNESGDHPHNVFAPTKQNKMCNRRSVWSVIQQHADFNPPSEHLYI
ncbi:Calcium-activated chloride channel regulator 1 [Lamellibrachia satsuma]|nr:Calcium-activated chloride channel regulator 1 [Lamellibrachia satsuma]